MKIARWILASICLLAIADLGLGKWPVSSFRSCSDQAAAVGSQAVVRVCGHLGLYDPAIVVLLLVAVLLVSKEVTVRIPGIVELERRVEEQNVRQASMSEELRLIRVQQSMFQANILNIQFSGVLPQQANVQDSLNAFDKKVGEFSEPE